MTFTVYVDDNPVDFAGETYTMEEAMKDLYNHIYMWDLNTHCMVEVESEIVEDIGDKK